MFRISPLKIISVLSVNLRASRFEREERFFYATISFDVI